MNNILIIGIITAAIIIAVAVLMRIRMSQQSSQPSLAVMPGSITDQPSSQPKEQFIVYSDVNFTGKSLELPGPGVYPLDPECGTGTLIPFKPKSVKMPDGYRIGFKGWYGNEGDTKCGPSIGWATEPSQFRNLTTVFSNWVYTNVGGSIVIEDKNIIRDRMDRHY